MQTLRTLLIAVGLLPALLVGLFSPSAGLAGGQEWRGLVSARPLDGNVGVWTIGGRDFTVTASTQLRQRSGALDAGACVEVEFELSGTQYVASELESKEPYRCGASGGGGGGGGGGGQDDDDDDDDDGDDDDDNDDDDDDGPAGLVGYGTIAQYPGSLIGAWRIGATDFTATNLTRFDDDDGPYGVGVCVEYRAADINGVATLSEVETAAAYKCSGSTAQQQRTTDVLGTFPAALIGDWQIGAATFSADAATRFEQDEGPFVSGVCVAVRHAVNGTLATEIKTVEAYRCSGAQQIAVARSYGIISSVAEQTPGTWTIGAAQYLVTAATELDTEDGELTVQRCAAVSYAQIDGINTATEIEAESPAKCQPNSFRSRLRGTVTFLPEGLYGVWLIGETPIEAIPSTRFNQEDGAFATNGCVKVRYYVLDGVNYAGEIASDDDCTDGATTVTAKVYGQIDALPAAPYVGDWTIGGIAYVATAATEFEEDDDLTFAIDGCVEARYAMVDGVATLLKVETKNPLRCGSDVTQLQAYGLIEALPQTIGAGDWTVSGITYQATLTTTFHEEHGLFVIGAFAEVTYLVEADGTLTALAIATHVAPGDGSDNSVGELESEPQVETGEWIIDGVTYVGDAAISVDLTAAAAGQSAAVRTGTTPVTVAVNSYRGIDGVRYITALALAEPVERLTFVPFASR